MEATQFILVVIDFKNNVHGNLDFIPNLLEELRTEIFRNESLLISKHTLLVKMPHEDLESYTLNPKYYVENILIEWEEKEIHVGQSFNDLSIYCFPINEENFVNELSAFEKEIRYLKTSNF